MYLVVGALFRAVPGASNPFMTTLLDAANKSKAMTNINGTAGENGIENGKVSINSSTIAEWLGPLNRVPFGKNSTSRTENDSDSDNSSSGNSSLALGAYQLYAGSLTTPPCRYHIYNQFTFITTTSCHTHI
jgi:hypothetical protein